MHLFLVQGESRPYHWKPVSVLRREVVDEHPGPGLPGQQGLKLERGRRNPPAVGQVLERPHRKVS